jgi:hypothetical protein
VYVSPEDIAAVLADAFMPQVMDWGMRFLMRPGPRHDVSFRALPSPREQQSETAE